MDGRSETDMLPNEEQLLRMSLKEIEHRLHGCSPTSDTWSVVWPVYEAKRPRAETKLTVIYFSISTTIALVALIRSFFPAPPKTDYQLRRHRYSRAFQNPISIGKRAVRVPEFHAGVRSGMV